jgi:hypothetical protein
MSVNLDAAWKQILSACVNLTSGWTQSLTDLFHLTALNTDIGLDGIAGGHDRAVANDKIHSPSSGLNHYHEAFSH